MPDQFKKVVTEDQKVVRSDGAVVREQSEAVHVQGDAKSTVANVIWYIYGFMAIVLLIRFVLKLLAANPNNSFVNFMYTVSGVLSAPFDSIFGVAKTSTGTATSVFEPSILVAIAVYGLVAWGVVKLLTLNKPNDSV